jgi:hypothetical protein
MEVSPTSFLNPYYTCIIGFHQNSVFDKPGIIDFCALDVLDVFMLASSSNLGEMSTNDKSELENIDSADTSGHYAPIHMSVQHTYLVLYYL